jgi:hypothetical protein
MALKVVNSVEQYLSSEANGHSATKVSKEPSDSTSGNTGIQSTPSHSTSEMYCNINLVNG